MTSLDNTIDPADPDDTHVDTHATTEQQEEPIDSESEVDDDEEDDDDDDSDYDEEPKLRYRRLGASVRELFAKDAASVLKVSDKFVVLGTHWGAVHVLDFEGNVVKSFQRHKATVNDISIDASDEYIASASDDGKIFIYGLYTDDIQHFDYRRPVKAVAIDPEYARKNTHQFASGGMAEQLIMNEKGWLGHQNTVLHANEGPIYSIQWRNNLIAWANDAGVKVYDTNSGLRISYIHRPANSPRPDLYKCRLVWKDDKTLMIGWANTVKVAHVFETPRQQQATGQPPLFMKIITMFQTDYIIGGIAPFNDTILLLAYLTEDEISSSDVDTLDPASQRRRLATRPELHIVDPAQDNEEVSVDVLAMHGFEHYQANDYTLGFLMEEDMFYIMGPKDVIVARPRDLDDHLEWLMEHGKYGEALQAAREEQQRRRVAGVESPDTISQRFDAKTIGQTYLNYLIDQKRYEDAAKESTDVLANDKAEWETWVFRLAELGQLQAIAHRIPMDNPRLSSTVYEMVLAWYMQCDQKTLLDIIHVWPVDLYNLPSIVVAMEDQLAKDVDNEILLECLADLYTYNNQPDKAIEYNLRLFRPNAFDLIQEYDMFEAVKDKAVLLLEFDQHLLEKTKRDDPTTSTKPSSLPAVQLLVKNTEVMPPSKIVRQLRLHRPFLHTYLDALFDRDHHLGAEFHDLQVELYAEYDYPKLLDFLRTSTYISLEKAYRTCEKKDLVPEMVFVLGRMGDNKKALMLIINRLGDVQRAIDFAKEQKDDDLWEDLLTYSMDKPMFIRGLLENVGTDIEPLRLIQRIPDNLEIDGLKDSLLKILQDYNLQMSLHQGCEKILVSDSVYLADRMYKTQKRGVHCQDSMQCAICEEPVFSHDDMDSYLNAMIFFCRHAFHEQCLLEKTDVHVQDLPSIQSTQNSLSSKVNHAAILKSSGHLVCPLCLEQQAGGNAFVNRMKSQRKSPVRSPQPSIVY
ncbi:vacuolar protein sorting-associated protein 41 [Hesseltinella vesiculosa]|uniref:Vacuolar protein sorting-associated protein 41 n=1 Tax=Hesseltinella vesiculosa TaxID=101127 RepID=A0A1X2GWY9_9FUNG|nr:vacuolar protein sorting-associated protein 41 [Hesseltinella vesiculosa]